MMPPLDILRLDETGQPLCLEVVGSLEIAKVRVKNYMQYCPAEYVIFSHRTGNKISIKPEKARSAAEPG